MLLILGNLGSDPEIKYTKAGDPVANPSQLQLLKSWKDKNSGDLQEKVEWHRVVMFSRLAEIAEQYLKKGLQKVL